MDTPTSRAALRWASDQMNNSFVTGILKGGVRAFRFEETDKHTLTLILDNEMSANVLRCHEAELIRVLIEGYADQGDLMLEEIVLEVE